MADTFSVAGRKAVVVGAARSGVAAAELLVARGATVVLTDVRSQIDGEEQLRRAGVALELGGHNPDTLANADLVVLSPGVPAMQPALEPARRNGVPVIGELELASRWLRGRIVAITGTKGKSTTTTLTGRILAAGGVPVQVGGNIGQALSSQVPLSNPDTIHVVEVSSFQLETIQTFHPWIAVFLNFSPDHLDRHASVEEYAEAKARIFMNQQESDWAVVNAEDAFVLQLSSGGRARQVPFTTAPSLPDGLGGGNGLVIANDTVTFRDTRRGDIALVPLSSIQLLGPHLRADVMAAAAVGHLAGIAPGDITRAVESFHGLEHALEPVAEIAGVRFVNDSKATNIAAARRAIESFDSGVVAILGGRFKGGDFGDLRGPLAARGRAVIAIGESAHLVRQALVGTVPVIDAATLRDAVRLGFNAAAPGGTVVLAPACSSFDMFRDYAERGRIFKQEVEKLAQEVRDARER